MIRRIELINFMSHRHTVIEPADGLTVLTGPNNSGKSAVVAALRLLRTNKPAAYAIRHGEKECRVRIVTDDGHEIVWRRTRRSASYTIDGEKFDRLRQGNVPDELHQVLRLPLIQAGDNQFDVHFGEQKSPIFLLDSPGPLAASFFASSSDASFLLKMQGLHKTEEKEKKRERDRLKKEMDHLDQELARLVPVDSIRTRLDRVKEEHHKLVGLSERIRRLTEDAKDLRTRSDRQKRLEAQTKAFASLAAPPRLDDTDALARAVSDLAEAGRRARVAARIARALESLNDPPDLHDERQLARGIQDLQRAHRSASRWRHTHRTLQSLPTVPALANEAALAQRIESLGQATADRDGKQKEFDKIAAAFQQAEHDLRRWAAAHPVCPICLREIDADEWVERTRAGTGSHEHD